MPMLKNIPKTSYKYDRRIRGGSRTGATSKMEHFGILVSGFQSLTIIIKSSILDLVEVLDPPLMINADTI